MYGPITDAIFLAEVAGGIIGVAAVIAVIYALGYGARIILNMIDGSNR